MEPFTALFLIVASLVITYAFTPKARAMSDPNPETFQQIEFPQVDEGTPQAVFFGDCWSGDWTVLAVGDYRTTPIQAQGGGGKKG